MKVIGVIPARFHSTRLEGKPLKDINGKPMIQWVYEGAVRSDILDEVIVATDDERIIDVVRSFNGKAVMTSKEHSSGTDRVAEVAEKKDCDIVVNIQGDEPFISPGMIDEVARPLMDDPKINMGTLMHPIRSEEDLNNPNVVKVVCDKSGFALYFSRSLIPYPRHREGFVAHEHIGIYSYRRDFLLLLKDMKQTCLEKIESLEQLRVLENGYKIKVIETKQKYIPLSVDTEDDLEKARGFAKSFKR